MSRKPLRTPPQPPAERISGREFARRDGCDESLVRLAVRNGRLKRDAAGKLDAALVGTGWRLGNVAAAPPTAEPEAPAGAESGVPLYSESLARKEAALAGLRELELAKAAGQLVDLATARTVMFECGRATRDAWANWPIDACPLMAADLGMDADRLLPVLTKYVHQHLADLGEPAGEFTPAK